MTQYSALVIICLMSTALSPALGMEMDVEVVLVKKEKKDPTQRATVLTKNGIQAKLGSINKGGGEVSCLEDAIKFVKWAIGQNKEPEQAGSYVPSTPNFEFFEPTDESSEDEHVVELHGFLRKCDAFEEVLRQNSMVMDVDTNRSYIDLGSDFKTLFRKRTKNDLASYFDSLSLKTVPHLKGSFSVGIINAFYAALSLKDTTLPTAINSHYFNFYIYQGVTPGKPKKILIVDSSSKKCWSLNEFMNSELINFYDENRFFTWSCTQPVRQPMPVKWEERINSPKPQNVNNLTNTDGLFMPRKQRPNLDVIDNPAPFKSQRTIENSSPNPLNNSEGTLRSQAQFQQSQGSPQPGLIAPTRLSSSSTQLQNILPTSIQPIKPFPPLQTLQNAPQNKNELPNQDDSSITEYVIPK
ncbi:MAG: hypothetical protein ACOH2E_07190 [Candidatus Paracaedibacter sp.]